MRFSLRDVAAVILAAGVTAAIVLLCVRALRSQPPIPSAEVELLALILGTAVGCVATYLGARGGDGTNGH